MQGQGYFCGWIMKGIRKGNAIALIFILIGCFCVNISYSESLRVPLNVGYKNVEQLMKKIDKKAALTDVDIFVDELQQTMRMLPLQSEILKEIAKSPKITNRRILSILSKKGGKHVNEAMVELLVNGELNRKYIIGLVKIIKEQIGRVEGYLDEIQTFALFGDELKTASNKTQRLMFDKLRDLSMSNRFGEQDHIAVNDLLSMFDNMVDDKELSYDFRIAIQNPMEIMSIIKQGERSLDRFLRNIDRCIKIMEGLQHGLKDIVGEYLYSTEKDYFANPSHEFNNILEWAEIGGPLTEEDIGEWMDGNIQLMPWRRIELPFSLADDRITIYLKNRKPLTVPRKFLSRFREENIEKVVLMSFKDHNLGHLVGVFTPSDFEEWKKGGKIKTPLVAYKYSDKKQRSKETIPFIMDLHLLSEGKEISVRPKGHPWSYQVKTVNLRQAGNGKVVFNLTAFDIPSISLTIPPEKIKEYNVKNGEEVVCMIIDDPNCGPLARIVKLKDFNPENPELSPNPLVEYLYIRDKFMPFADIAVIDIMHFASGRKDLKEMGRKISRKVRVIEIEKESGEKEIESGEIKLKIAPNRKVWKMIRFYFKKDEIKEYDLTNKPVIMELKVDPDFGPYVSFSVEKDGKEVEFGTNLYVFEVEKNNVRKNLNHLALLFYGFNRKNIHDNPVIPRVYKHPSKVSQPGSIRLSSGDMDMRILGLDKLKGKKPIFVPERDTRHGWVIKVYDQDTYDPDSDQSPEVELVRNISGQKNVVLVKKEAVEKKQDAAKKQGEFGLWSQESAISQVLDIYKAMAASASMKSELEKLHDKLLRLTQWDLKNRFPRRTSLWLFYGTDKPELHDKTHVNAQDITHISDSPVYANQFGEPGVIIVNVPKERIQNVWWLSFPEEESIKPELLISDGLPLEVRFRSEGRLGELKGHQKAHKRRYNKWKKLTENIKTISDIEFSNGKIDIENLGNPETVFPTTNFRDTGTLFPVTNSKSEMIKFVRSLGIYDLSVALDDLVLNAIEHQDRPRDTVTAKIEIFKDKEILKITVKQPSSSKDARNRLDINKKGFDLYGTDYLIDAGGKRGGDGGFKRRGGFFRVISSFILFNPVHLIYKIDPEKPHSIEVNFYIPIKKIAPEYKSIEDLILSIAPPTDS